MVPPSTEELIFTNNSETKLVAAGSNVGFARQVLTELPEDRRRAASTLAREALNRLGVLDGTVFTVAEIEIPGTGVAIPLTIDLADFIGSS